ncbi:ABC transporter permease [Brevibacillus migulae]|uniref:ABC transporter permease n=1 Tax=Brevibacillus migulae TaxID=1644114 RepID=UPI00106ECA5D|nr:ABC transporter permease [Brevibacillus migulae]
MSSRHVWMMFQKELLDIWRDTKTWIAALVIPFLVIPSIIYLMTQSISNVEQEARAYVPIVITGDTSQGLVAHLQKEPGVKLLTAADPIQAVKEGAARAVIMIPPKLDQALRQGALVNMEVWYDAANQKSVYARELIEKSVRTYEEGIVSKRLEAAGLTSAAMHPISLSVSNLASQERVSGSMLASIVPLMLMLALASGGIPVATDIVAGEKDRGTLETLITAPVSAQSILTAKLLTVMTMGLVSSLASGASLMWVLRMQPKEGEKLTISFLQPESAVLLLGTLVLLSAFFAAVELCLSTIARSPREAHIYMTPVAFLALIPSYLIMPLTPADIPFAYYLLPIFNGAALLKEIFYGQIEPWHVLIVLSTSLLYVVLTISLAAALFRREGLLVK